MTATALTSPSEATVLPTEAAACAAIWQAATAGHRVRWGRWTQTPAGRRKLVYDRVGDAPAEMPLDRHVAVETYDADGYTSLLPVDLDVKNGHDSGDLVPVVFELAQLLDRIGGGYIWDESPTSEGMHVLIPLPEPAHHDEVAPVARALRRWARQWADVVDTRPAVGLPGACITLPGTIDKGGRPRRLMQSPADVLAALSDPGASGLLGRLAEALAEYMDEPQAPAAAPRVVVQVPRGETMLVAFARGGILPPGYASTSEARLGAIRSLAGAGYSQDDLWAAIGDGTFAGIADSYLNNHPSLAAARRRFDVEWVKAVTGIGPRIDVGPTDARWTVRAIAAAIRIEAAQAATAADRSRIDTLQAVAYMAAVAGGVHVDVGCRALTFAAGLPSHSGIAHRMNVEAGREDPFLAKVSRHSRDLGTRWRIQLPARYAFLLDVEYRGQVRATSIAPVHSVYSALGRTARWLLEALEEHGPLSRLRLIARSGVSESYVDVLLARLVDAGLVTRDVDGTVRRTSLGLDKVARRLGVPEAIQARREAYAAQRAEWRAFWDQVVATPDPSAPIEEPPPADAWFADVGTAGSPPAGADPPF